MQFVLLTNISIHTCPNCDWSGRSSRIEDRGEAASLLSRGAATVCSPGRKPGEDVVFEVKPRRGERSDERSECKPDRAQPVRDERSECKPDAKRKRDSAQPQERAQPVRDERSECKPDAKRKRDSAQPQDAKRKRDSAQPQGAKR